MFKRRVPLLAGLATIGLVFGLAASQANAQYYSYYSAPVYVSPAPVYVAPAPVYVAPRVYSCVPSYTTYNYGYSYYPHYKRYYHRPYHHGRSIHFGFSYRR
jgi:hypothetical protein